MSANTEELKQAVSHAQKMLQHNAFAPALEQGNEILKHVADEPNALFITACAYRGLGQLPQAKSVLQKLIQQQAGFALAHQELGFTLQGLNHTQAAIKSLTQALAIKADLPSSWKLLAELQMHIGNDDKAQHAYNRYLQFSASDPKLGEALAAFIANKLARCEQLCREHLQAHPNDVNAIRLLAEVATKLGIYIDAETLLTKCLTIEPRYQLARLNYANVLNKREKSQQALVQIEMLEKQQPDYPPHQITKATILVKLGQFDQAIILYDKLINLLPKNASLYTSRGHALKTVGAQEKAIKSYRSAIAIQPSYGEAYWSLANLKTFCFEQIDINAMQKQLEHNQLSSDDKVNICFALGKALEDQNEVKQSFAYYQQGNDIKQKIERYDADETTNMTDRTIATCSDKLFRQYQGTGCEKADPIFILGLPRSGSTLLEQVLSSHSLVDGTKELPSILAAVRTLSDRNKRDQVSKYPEVLASLAPQRLHEMGEEYLEKANVHRGSAPFFIDKMPNNFAHIGLIKLILPNAKIIDARRSPMATCFSGFKQLFATGQSFSYGLENIGRYYLDYIRLMNHWHQVLPGQILTVNYEEVVNDFEKQVRHILDYCQLPFEQSCLEFYNNKRAVNTASSEQVRQPIYQSGLTAWSAYEPYLSPLKTILKPIL